VGNAAQTARPRGPFDLRPPAAAIATLLVAWVATTAIQHSLHSRTVVFEVRLEHGGVASHSDIRWVLGAHDGNDTLPVTKKDGPEVAWHLQKTAHIGDSVHLSAQALGFTWQNRGQVNQHCSVFVIMAGGTIALPVHGTLNNTQCDIYSAVL
jgi:hypothetical protein